MTTQHLRATSTRGTAADCMSCQGAPGSAWARYRLEAARLCGPHPVVVDLGCPHCGAGSGELCTAGGGRDMTHAPRIDRWLRAHGRYMLLTLNVADAVTDALAGRPPGPSTAAARVRHRELVRAMRGSGLTYVVPTVADVQAGAAAAGGPVAGGAR